MARLLIVSGNEAEGWTSTSGVRKKFGTRSTTFTPTLSSESYACGAKIGLGPVIAILLVSAQASFLLIGLACPGIIDWPDLTELTGSPLVRMLLSEYRKKHGTRHPAGALMIIGLNCGATEM